MKKFWIIVANSEEILGFSREFIRSLFLRLCGWFSSMLRTQLDYSYLPVFFFFWEQEEMNTESQTTTPVNATFLANLKDRFSGLVNTPMDEHKTCFKNTMDKVRSQFSISPSTKEKVRAQFSISYWMPKDDAQKKVDGV